MGSLGIAVPFQLPFIEPPVDNPACLLLRLLLQVLQRPGAVEDLKLGPVVVLLVLRNVQFFFRPATQCNSPALPDEAPVLFPYSGGPDYSRGLGSASRRPLVVL